MYVLLEDEEVSQSLLSSLNPIIQKNQESLSLINRVEVSHVTRSIYVYSYTCSTVVYTCRTVCMQINRWPGYYSIVNFNVTVTLSY